MVTHSWTTIFRGSKFTPVVLAHMVQVGMRGLQIYGILHEMYVEIFSYIYYGYMNIWYLHMVYYGYRSHTNIYMYNHVYIYVHTCGISYGILWYTMPLSSELGSQVAAGIPARSARTNCWVTSH